MYSDEKRFFFFFPPDIRSYKQIDWLPVPIQYYNTTAMVLMCFLSRVRARN